jgi:hypothetical protein
MAGDAAIELVEELADGGVGLGQREEPPVPELGQDPSLDDLDADLDLGLVARLARSGRDHGGAVMGRHLGVGAVDVGLVEAGLGDA